jgi:hypothetical protein
VIAGPAVVDMLAGTDTVLVPAPTPDGVVLSAAHTVPEALAAHPGGPHLVVMADTFTREDVVHARRAGVRALLQTSRTTPHSWPPPSTPPEPATAACPTRSWSASWPPPRAGHRPG